MPVKWLSSEKCESLLTDQVYGRLATTGADSRPYITPVNYVYTGDTIFIHSAFKGRKLENLRRNNRVCFEISSDEKLYVSGRACGFSMRYWSVIIEGTAEEVSDLQVKRLAIDSLMEKYGRGYVFTPAADDDLHKVNVIRINIETISGKSGVDPE